MSDFLNQLLADQDPQINELINQELKRQQDQIELIASENFTSKAVMQAAGSVLTNKYAEGYPGRRYYGGCEVVDEVEQLAIERAKSLFGAEHANVQPHAGSQANMAVYMALLKPGDTILGMSLAHGGHLTHGHSVNFSGKLFNFVHYGVDKNSHLIDYDELQALAKEHRPKLIVAGGSAYPRFIDAKKFRDIADSVGAMLMIDMAHFAGIVAAKLHPEIIKYADVVTSTTHKTLRGPRSGLILSKQDYAQKIDKAVFPGMQGGPLCHIVAAKAVCFLQASLPEYQTYMQAVLDNTRALGKRLSQGGVKLISGGTDTHLLLADVSDLGINGQEAETMLEAARVTVNRNGIPFDPLPPMVTSGIRAGMAAMTSRGMGIDASNEIGEIMLQALTCDNAQELNERSLALLQKYPLY